SHRPCRRRSPRHASHHPPCRASPEARRFRAPPREGTRTPSTSWRSQAVGVKTTDKRDLVREQFGKHAENFVASEDHAKGESLDRLLALTRPRPDWRVLDIATGGGHTALALAPHVREVIASDLTPPMLDAARAFIASKGVTNVVFREADAISLPFEAEAFDLVTCRIAPHHFPDVQRFVHEMFRVLKPGGVAVVIDNVVPEDPVAAKFINDFET